MDDSPSRAGLVSTAAFLRGHLAATPVLRNPVLDQLVGCECFVKAENVQLTGAYKVRGAWAALHAARATTRRCITASAGNFGQGVAWGASELGLDALIVVPQGTPQTKIDRIHRFGGEVLIAGDNFEHAQEHARRLAAEQGALFLPPFDHPRVIEGQGTAIYELLREVPDLDAVVVPCGGGGLLAGAALAAEELRPEARLVAVEPEVLPSLRAALAAGRPVPVPPARSLADGIAVREIGRLPWQVVKDRVHAVLTVSEVEVLEAIRLIALELKQVAEGAGAAAIAALVRRPAALAGCKRIGVVLSGGNIDPAVLATAPQSMSLASGARASRPLFSGS